MSLRARLGGKVPETLMKLSGVRQLRMGLAFAWFASGVLGQTQSQAPLDLRDASLEDLMDIKVTSVSKKEEKLSRAAAAVFVITQEDIRRSGATSIPDLLRMAPGVDVEQIDANAWAISIRGFNSRYANKVLVLVDGRTVYSPSFSGVFWDQLDLPLEDLERIEVIRGPGGTVWGANAVNGVISIITKSAKDTKGGLATAGMGSQTRAFGELQYGGAAGQDGTYRVFGSYFNVGNSDSQNGGAANDRWQRMHAGFRSDWDLLSGDSLTVQGDLFDNQENQTTDSSSIPSATGQNVLQTVDAAGGNLLARWNHTLSGGSQTSFQAYYDTYRRTDSATPAKVSTFDLDFQHHVSAGDDNDIVWGLGYRSDTSGLAAGYPTGYVPSFRTVSLFNVFFQDEIRISDSLWFTIGAKLEHNAYTGFETEPSARMVWSPPDGRYTVWAAASKSVRQPSQTDATVVSDVGVVPLGNNPIESLVLMGNPNIKAEQVRDYEIGYRSDLTKSLSFELDTFLSFYHDLETLDPQSPIVLPGSPTIVEIPLLFENAAHALDYGGELFLTWRATSFWRISPGYSYLHANIRQDPPAQGIPSADVASDFPRNMIQVRSQFNLRRKFEFDQSLYYTARLPGGAIPGHARLDLRVARSLGEASEISVVGQNLLRNRTVEYGDSSGVVGTELVRSVYARISYRF